MNIIEQSVIEGQYDVRLVKLPEGHYGYAVVYGLQVSKYGCGIAELQKALDEYNSCVIHQMGCAGWMDED